MCRSCIVLVLYAFLWATFAGFHTIAIQSPFYDFGSIQELLRLRVLPSHPRLSNAPAPLSPRQDTDMESSQ
jgi:hypothetical protein